MKRNYFFFFIYKVSFTSYGDIKMGYNTKFQQKNNYPEIENRLLKIINKNFKESNINYKNLIISSRKVLIENYNELLNVINHKALSEI